MPRLSLLLGLFALVLAASCATGSGSGFSREQSRERSSHSDNHKDSSDDFQFGNQEEEEEDPPPTVTISASPGNARITIDGRYAGTGTAELSSFGFGQSVTVVVEAPSYRSQTVKLALWNQTETVTVSLDPIVGTLELGGSNLEGATFFVPGWTAGPGKNSLLIGSHQLTVRRFGYREETLTFTIKEDQTTAVTVDLLPAPFELTQFRHNHPAGFNPESAAVAAQTSISFMASGPGHAEIVLRDKKGRELARWAFAALTTWHHQVEWDGRFEGVPLPDGNYVATLTGGAETGTDTFKKTLRVRIDRSLVDQDRPSLGPAAGYLWTPTPEVLSPGTWQFSALTLGHVEEAGALFPASTALRFSPDTDWEVFAQTSFRFWHDYYLNSGYATVAVKQRIDIDAKDFRLAWVAGGTLGSWLYGDAGIPPTDFLTTFPGLRFLLPASWDWGRWTLVVAPEIDVSYWSPSTGYEIATAPDQGTRFWAYGRAAIAYDAAPFSFAVSGVARTNSFDVGTGWMAPAHLGFEGRYTVPDSPLTLTGYLSVSAYSSVDYAWYGGFGLSLLLPASLTPDMVSLF